MTERLSGAGGTNVKPQKIDRDALHRYLYRRADPFGRLKLNVKKLSSELELAYCNLTLVIADMAETGRIRHIGGSRYATKTYVIVDPAIWADER